VKKVKVKLSYTNLVYASIALQAHAIKLRRDGCIREAKAASKALERIREALAYLEFKGKAKATLKV